MIVDVRSVDVSTQLAQIPPGEAPVATVARYMGEGHVMSTSPGHDIVDNATWVILQSRLPEDFDKLKLGEDHGGTHVAVPLHGYLFGDISAGSDILVKFGLQFGILVMRWAATLGEIERLLVIHSKVFERPDSRPGYLVYAGAAIKLK